MSPAVKPEPAVDPSGSAPSDADAMARARHLLAAPKPEKPLSFNAMLRATAMIVATASFGLTGFAVGGPADMGQVAPRSDIDIRVGRNDHSGRVEIYGSVGSRASVRREADQVVIRLPGKTQPDLGDIRANPPIGIAGVDVKSDARATELWLKVSDGYDVHFGRGDGGVYIQIDPSALAKTPSSDGKSGGAVTVNPALMPAAPQVAATPGQHVNAVATPPVVPVEVADGEGGRDLTFAFQGPAAAAVFRRGDAIWIVFDTEVQLRLPPELKDGNVVQDVQWTHNDGFTAMRLSAPTTGSLSVRNEGLIWRVRLGGRQLDNNAAQVGVVRDDSSGSAGLNVNLAGATKIAWIRDPAVGDRMAIVPARAPVKNLANARTTLEATLASTAQGVVVEHMTPDVTVAVDGDLIEVTRPGGLTLSTLDPNAKPNDSQLEYKAALYPAIANPDWSNTPAEGFLARYTALQGAAADEAVAGANAGTKARLSLARFLIGQGLSYEAQGALDLLTKQSPRALDDPQVRGLRVLAKMMSGRYADATGDLSSAQLVADPSSRLWAGYAEAKAGHYADAVKDFNAGMKAIGEFPVEWRTRLAASYAYAAMQQNDLKTAQGLIGFAVAQPAPPLEKLRAFLVDAQIIEASGDKARALGVYSAVSRASDDSIAAPALMHAAMLSYQLKKTNADQVLASLDSLRFRWRGDDTELQLVANMGQIYLGEGRYREALQILKTGDHQFADHPQAVQIQTSLNQAFRSLFLGGMADGLQPIEALGLFNDFKELTPIGADGDEMVRKVVRRLVDVDLLDQAAELLEYQVNNRLDGVAKSSVASDLAAIYLMNRDPQKALQTLWNTRTTLLPKDVMSQRRVLEARALNDLNEPDKAIDALGGDTSSDADDVRAEIYWKQSNWAKTAAVLEKRLGDRFKNDNPLSLAEESRVIRAGVAYSLAHDQVSLSRLNDHFGKFSATASSPDAMRVALASLDQGPISAKDFALAAAQTDSFTGWVAAMKKKFREKDDAASAAIKLTPASATLPSAQKTPVAAAPAKKA